MRLDTAGNSGWIIVFRVSAMWESLEVTCVALLFSENCVIHQSECTVLVYKKPTRYMLNYLPNLIWQMSVHRLTFNLQLMSILSKVWAFRDCLMVRAFLWDVLNLALWTVRPQTINSKCISCEKNEKSWISCKILEFRMSYFGFSGISGRKVPSLTFWILSKILCNISE